MIKKDQYDPTPRLTEFTVVHADEWFLVFNSRISETGADAQAVVGRWLRPDNNTFRILVELRDVNYPGSTYSLQYEQSTDRLIGTYFQSVEKATFSIEFVRAK
ncbi:MAG: hypothetical protein VR64_21580 [Desulfatitalea sp. BRH_c12]|nr:MAG: hypothetical protein VR64_21580 [Desulfatitalea sp. BRH_c12]